MSNKDFIIKTLQDENYEDFVKVKTTIESGVFGVCSKQNCPYFVEDSDGFCGLASCKLTDEEELRIWLNLETLFDKD